MIKDKNLLYIALASLITTLIWITVSTLTTYKKVEFTEVDQEMLSPIESEINFEGVLR